MAKVWNILQIVFAEFFKIWMNAVIVLDNNILFWEVKLVLHCPFRPFHNPLKYGS